MGQLCLSLRPERLSVGDRSRRRRVTRSSWTCEPCHSSKKSSRDVTENEEERGRKRKASSTVTRGDLEEWAKVSEAEISWLENDVEDIFNQSF